MPLKYKSVVSLFLFLFFVGVFYFLSPKTAPPIMRIRIAVPLQSQSEKIIRQKKEELLNPELTSRTWQFLGRKPKKSTPLEVRRMAGLPIFEISAPRLDPKTSKIFLNALLRIFAEQDLEDQLEAHRLRILSVERKITALQKIRESAEAELRLLRAQNKPDEVDAALEKKLRETEKRDIELSAIYKENHPERVELAHKIDSLQRQIADGPPRPSSETLLQKEAAIQRLIKEETLLKAQLEDLHLQTHGFSSRILPLQYA